MSTATRVAAGVTAAYLRELTRDTAGAGPAEQLEVDPPEVVAGGAVSGQSPRPVG
jgi:hypothetical protein